MYHRFISHTTKRYDETIISLRSPKIIAHVIFIFIAYCIIVQHAFPPKHHHHRRRCSRRKWCNFIWNGRGPFRTVEIRHPRSRNLKKKAWERERGSIWGTISKQTVNWWPTNDDAFLNVLTVVWRMWNYCAKSDSSLSFVWYECVIWKRILKMYMDRFENGSFYWKKIIISNRIVLDSNNLNDPQSRKSN